MVDRLSGSHDSLVQKWILHVQHADALRGYQHDHCYTHINQVSLPPAPAATDTVTHECGDSESSKTSSESYDSPLEVPSPFEGNTLLTNGDEHEESPDYIQTIVCIYACMFEADQIPCLLGYLAHVHEMV